VVDNGFSPFPLNDLVLARSSGLALLIRGVETPEGVRCPVVGLVEEGISKGGGLAALEDRPCGLPGLVAGGGGGARVGAGGVGTPDSTSIGAASCLTAAFATGVSAGFTGTAIGAEAEGVATD
jgi:hypothetical protein